MTETYDPVSHIAVIALIVFYWHLLRIWHQPPPSDRDRDTATRKPAAPQQLAAETDSQKGRSLRANARGTAISPAAQAERAPATSPCNAPFDESSFLAGAAVAYERVLEAYIDEDEDVLQQLLDPALLAVFVEAISARKKRAERRELIFIGIRDMRTLQTRADPTMTTVTVRFVSEAVLVTYGMDGAVVDGHPPKVVQMTDDWSFARPRSSTDPNWQLVATGGIGHAPKKRPDISRQHFIQSRPDYESSPATPLAGSALLAGKLRHQQVGSQTDRRFGERALQVGTDAVP